MNEQEINGLCLWKSLVKDGCRWDGDIFSKRWSEVLIVPEGVKVEATLSAYKEGEDFKVERDSTGAISCVWIA